MKLVCLTILALAALARADPEAAAAAPAAPAGPSPAELELAELKGKFAALQGENAATASALDDTRRQLGAATATATTAQSEAEAIKQQSEAVERKLSAIEAQKKQVEATVAALEAQVADVKLAKAASEKKLQAMAAEHADAVKVRACGRDGFEVEGEVGARGRVVGGRWWREKEMWAGV